MYVSAWGRGGARRTTLIGRRNQRHAVELPLFRERAWLPGVLALAPVSRWEPARSSWVPASEGESWTVLRVAPQELVLEVLEEVEVLEVLEVLAKRLA
jgi:hypothetical protein